MEGMIVWRKGRAKKQKTGEKSLKKSPAKVWKNKFCFFSVFSQKLAPITFSELS
jgi:hypothetical protein